MGLQTKLTTVFYKARQSKDILPIAQLAVGSVSAQLSGYPLMIFLIFWLIEKTQKLISVRKKA